MILNAQDILKAQQDSEIEINPFEESQIQAATYDLRVGEQGATTTAKKLIDIKKQGYLLLEPGDFGIVTILEELRLGNQYAGRFGLRSKYARKGLLATTGPQIDPGYYGRLMIGLSNPTPKAVTIPYKDHFVSVELHKLEEPTTKPYDGPYQGKLELGPDEIEMITDREGMALSEVLTTLSSLSQNVAMLADRVKVLQWLIPVAIAIFGLIAIFK